MIFQRNDSHLGDKKWGGAVDSMGQRTLKNVNSCKTTKIKFYLKTSDGQNSTLYKKFVHFSNTSDN
jgi:hypothetical protein